MKISCARQKVASETIGQSKILYMAYSFISHNVPSKLKTKS